MAFAQEKKQNVCDIYALPEGTRAELIDGKMYMMAPPSRKHQEISMALSSTIHQYTRRKQGNCKVFAAPFAVFLNADDKTYVEPDISIVCDGAKLDDRGCNGAPDWIIAPENNRAMVYLFEQDDANMYSFTDEIPVGIYNGDLKIRIE